MCHALIIEGFFLFMMSVIKLNFKAIAPTPIKKVTIINKDPEINTCPKFVEKKTVNTSIMPSLSAGNSARIWLNPV